MMKVKVAQREGGLHPSEVVVAIQTSDGEQYLVVDKRSLTAGDYIKVGYPIRRKGDLYLIELPRETTSGSWRVWVHRNETKEDERQYA